MGRRGLQEKFDWIDRTISGWMHYYAHFLLRWSLGIIFIWFGALKPFGLSPAQELIAQTVYWFDPEVFVPVLGWWEVAIGVTLILRMVRVSIALLALQMAGTFLPLVILPDVCFTQAPFGLTLEGQYIIKNLIIISAALVLGGDVRLPEQERKHRKL